MGIFSVISNLINPVKDIIDDLHTSGEEKAEATAKLFALQAELEVKLLAHEADIVQAQAEVIKAEYQHGNALSRSWRPITMLTFVFIIFNNFVLAPYASALGFAVPTLEVPNGMWALLNVGIGGFIAGRSIEKTFKIRNGGSK